jgi:hypothetical protein
MVITSISLILVPVQAIIKKKPSRFIKGSLRSECDKKPKKYLEFGRGNTGAKQRG